MSLNPNIVILNMVIKILFATLDRHQIDYRNIDIVFSIVTIIVLNVDWC